MSSLYGILGAFALNQMVWTYLCYRSNKIGHEQGYEEGFERGEQEGRKVSGLLNGDIGNLGFTDHEVGLLKALQQKKGAPSFICLVRMALRFFQALEHRVVITGDDGIALKGGHGGGSSGGAGGEAVAYGKGSIAIGGKGGDSA